jgi:hypothetical protein
MLCDHSHKESLRIKAICLNYGQFNGKRLLRHLSSIPNVAIYVPITVIGETVVEYLTEDASRREINELHELIDFWGVLHLNFLYPTDLVADAWYKLVEMYRRGSRKDYRLSDTDLVHLGYALPGL